MRAILARWTFGISVHLERRDGHLRTSYSHTQRQRGVGGMATAAVEHCPEAADCGRDADDWDLGGTSSAGAQCEQQSGIWLASTVFGRTVGGAEGGHEVATSAGERE